MISSNDETPCTSASDVTKEKIAVSASSPRESSSTTPSEAYCLQAVRQARQTQNISENVFNIICHSWRRGTQKQYGVALRQWARFCARRQVSYYQPSVAQILDFLAERFEAGVGYSALNTARCALSTIIVFGNITAGSHPLVIRFMKGVYNLRPPQARYVSIWDPAVVLQYLRKLSPAKFLTLKDLTL